MLIHLLSSIPEGSATIAVLSSFSLEKGFELLRRLSGLTILLPQDLDLVPDLARIPASAGTSRWLKFPRFSYLLDLIQKVRCYSLCKKMRNYKTVSVTMGLTISEVKRAESFVRRKAAGVEELWVKKRTRNRR